MKKSKIKILLPKCEKGLGEIISSPEAAGLIEGVRIQPLSLYPDDRGYFLEILRVGQGLVSDFGAKTMQASAAYNYPGAIKAFHYHQHQTDVFTPVMGLLQIVLVDLRQGSPTFGQRNTIYSGPLRLWQILIPPGVGHGYKVLGAGPSMLVYATDHFYDPQDEGRIPYNHPGINYDWELQHK